jgi:hypothetical protein
MLYVRNNTGHVFYKVSTHCWNGANHLSCFLTSVTRKCSKFGWIIILSCDHINRHVITSTAVFPLVTPRTEVTNDRSKIQQGSGHLLKKIAIFRSETFGLLSYCIHLFKKIYFLCFGIFYK